MAHGLGIFGTQGAAIFDPSYKANRRFVDGNIVTVADTGAGGVYYSSSYASAGDEFPGITLNSGDAFVIGVKLADIALSEVSVHHGAVVYNPATGLYDIGTVFRLAAVSSPGTIPYRIWARDAYPGYSAQEPTDSGLQVFADDGSVAYDSRNAYLDLVGSYQVPAAPGITDVYPADRQAFEDSYVDVTVTDAYKNYFAIIRSDEYTWDIQENSVATQRQYRRAVSIVDSTTLRVKWLPYYEYTFAIAAGSYYYRVQPMAVETKPPFEIREYRG